MAHQRRTILAVVGIEGDAHADADVEALIFEDEGFFHDGDQFAGGVYGILLVFYQGQQYREFITAQAGDSIGFAQSAA